MAVRVADRIVMPVPPKAADLDRVAATAQIADGMGKPAAAVLTQVRGGIEDAAAAAVTLRSWGVPVYASQLPLTVAVQRAYGQPVIVRAAPAVRHRPAHRDHQGDGVMTDRKAALADELAKLDRPQQQARSGRAPAVNRGLCPPSRTSHRRGPPGSR